MIFSSDDFSFHHNTDEITNPGNDELHNHYHAYEIFVFLSGDAEFIVEGAIYPLNPYDIIFMAPNEFHHIRHRSSSEYERLVLHIQSPLFTKYGCDIYRHMFDRKKPGIQNMIPSAFVTEHNVMDILGRIEKYCNETDGEIAARCAVIELLHILNKYRHPTVLSFNNEKITPIIAYINENLTSPLNIDIIAENFFINKYYLCRLFKKHTGLTINKYITYKRIALAKKLHHDGKTLLQASSEAGFGNYSNFYKMYVKETGKSPKTDI